MDVLISFYRNFSKQSLPILTVFILIVDAAILLTFGLKSDGWTRLTDGDIVVLVVMMVITVCVAVAIVWWTINKRMSPIKSYVEACTQRIIPDLEFQCAICHENAMEFPDYVVKVKCLHTFHEKCIRKWVEKNSSEEQVIATCPYCRSVLEPINTVLEPINKTAHVPVFNWQFYIWGKDAKERGIVSCV